MCQREKGRKITHFLVLTSNGKKSEFTITYDQNSQIILVKLECTNIEIFIFHTFNLLKFLHSHEFQHNLGPVNHLRDK